MAIKLEPELRESFIAVARSQHRPAAQLIREFMRRYIAENAKGVPLPPPHVP